MVGEWRDDKNGDREWSEITKDDKNNKNNDEMMGTIMNNENGLEGWRGCWGC
jgi:hypothetical protein